MTSNHTLHASRGPPCLHSMRRVMVSPQMLLSVYRKLTAIFRMIHISCTIFPRHAQKHHKRHAKASHQSYPSSPVQARTPSRQPNIPKQKNQAEKEPNPNLPTNASFLRHAQHPVHRASQAISRALELVVHFLSQSSGVSDFAADCVRQLIHQSA